MGNIGSEVARAIRAKQKGDTVRMGYALEAALELFDLTIADPKYRGLRLREICRAREVFCDFLVGENEYLSDGESLDRYFLEFAMAARKDR